MAQAGVAQDGRSSDPPGRRVRIIGTSGDYGLRDFLTRSDLPYEWVDAADASAEIARRGLTVERLPIVIVDDTVLVGATIEGIADAFGGRTQPLKTEYDVLIVGAGPAGLAAAVYAASDGLSVAVAEGSAPGGQASSTGRIENYFGIDPSGPPMTGAHLASVGVRQAESFGAELLILRAVVSGGFLDDGRHELELSTGEKLAAPCVIIATGVDWRRLEVDGIEEFLGRGIYFGAGRSEAPFLDDCDVVVVGGGNSAGQAALTLAERARRVTMLCRGPALSASLSAYLATRIETHPRIEVRMKSQVTAVSGGERLEAITTNNEEVLRTDAMFLTLGGVPRTAWAAGHGLLTDPAGYFLTGHDLLEDGRPPDAWPLERSPHALESSIPGIFVAGDVRHGSTKRVAGAVGEGAMAVALVNQYLVAESERSPVGAS